MALTKKDNMLVRDENLHVIQAGNSVRFEDATAGTTVKSPLSITNDNEIVLTVPTGAIAIVVKPKSADLRIAAASGETATKYGLVSDGENDIYDCAGMTSVYVKRHTATGMTLYFRFIVV